MGVLIGLLLIAGGIGYACWNFIRTKNASTEMKFMQTSTVEEATSLVRDMASADPDYHHYVELKGQLNCDTDVNAPFSEQAVAYYRNQCLAVYEERVEERDSQGNRRTRMVKREQEMAQEESSAPVYLTDPSSNEKVYVDLSSFGGDCDLQSGCDRLEPPNSPWSSRYQSQSRWNSIRSGVRFLGYRLKEEVLFRNQPVYVLGELYRHGDRFYVGRSVVAKKPSQFSYKSEDALLQDMYTKRNISVGIGAAMVLVGIIMVVAKLL